MKNREVKYVVSNPSMESGGNIFFKAAGAILIATVWISMLLFGLFILSFYGAAYSEDQMVDWNDGLPGLYDPEERSATVGIGLHFAAGALILMMGCIQLLDGIPNRFPKMHRWMGRVYVTSALLTAIGGLTFIFIQGTVGGWIMDMGFGIYGVLTFIAAIATYRYARAGDFTRHRAWAIRLFVLALGSWLYRMDYGFWFAFTDGLGHERDFTGWFDRFMAFFFYLPNLMVAEIFIQKRYSRLPWVQLVGGGVISLASLFIIIATYYFTKRYWGPAIVDFLF